MRRITWASSAAKGMSKRGAEQAAAAAAMASQGIDSDNGAGAA